MPDSHRGRHRHDSLFEELEPDEGQSGWMLSYIDMMTLLVALFALLLSLTAVLRAPSEAAAQEVAANALVVDVSVVDAPVAKRGAEISPFALAAALRVGEGLRPRAPRPSGREPLALPGLAGAWPLEPLTEAFSVALAGAPAEAVTPPLALNGQAAGSPAEALPRIALHERLDPEAWDDLTLVVTERPPSNVRRLDPEALAEAERLQAEVSTRLDEARQLPSLEGVEISPVAEGLNLRIQDQLLFDSATAELSEGGRELIERLVEIIQRHEGTVSVEGHSDDRPIFTDRFPSNWELSSARAIVILRQLEGAGVEASRLRAIGYGETRPLADNDSPEGRAANRRVEVVVHL